MPNPMMILALERQRAGKMEPQKDSPQSSSGQDKSGGDIAARLDALEKQYQELCQFVGMDKTDSDSSGKAY